MKATHLLTRFRSTPAIRATDAIPPTVPAQSSFPAIDQPCIPPFHQLTECFALIHIYDVGCSVQFGEQFGDVGFREPEPQSIVQQIVDGREDGRPSWMEPEPRVDLDVHARSQMVWPPHHVARS